MDIKSNAANQIKELREKYKKREIEIKELYVLAKDIFQSNSDDEDTKFQMLWVYFDYLKHNENNIRHWLLGLEKVDELILNVQRDIYTFLENLERSFIRLIINNNIKSLSLFENKKYLYDYNFVKEIPINYYEYILWSKIRENKKRKAYKISDIEEELCILIDRESRRLTDILVTILSDKKESRDEIIELFNLKGDKWFNPNILSIMHHKTIKNPNSDNILNQKDSKSITLLESFLIKYIKSILPYENANGGIVFNDQVALKIVDSVDLVLQKYPKYEWLRYHFSKLLLELDEKSKGKTNFLPFARSHIKDYYVWELLGDLSSNSEEQGLMYIRALSCKPQQSTKRKILVKAIPHLIKHNLLLNATAEINHYLDYCNKNKLNVDPDIVKYQNESWMSNNKNIQFELYDFVIISTNKVLYSDIPYQDIFVTYINHEKRAVNFNFKESGFGFFFVDNRFDMDQIKLYDSLNVQIISDDFIYRIEKKYQLLDINFDYKDLEIKSKYIKSFKNKLIKIKTNKFGFTDDDIYIHPSVLESVNLSDVESNPDNCFDDENTIYTIEGFKVFKFDPKRKKECWVVTEINNFHKDE